MRVIRLLSLRRLRLQPARAVLSAIVVGAGVSLVVAIVVIVSSLNTSVLSAGRALAGPAPLRITGPMMRGGVTPGLVHRIEGTKGVAHAIPLVQGITFVDPGGGLGEVPVMLLGFDCRVQALFGDFGCDPAALGGLTTPIVSRTLARDLRAGANVRTELGRVPLAGALQVGAVDALNGGKVVAFPLAEAQRQLGRGDAVDTVYVVPSPGQSVPELKARLVDRVGQDDVVLAASDAPPVVGVILKVFIPLFTIIALLTLGIGATLVRNSIALSLEERRRQTAIVGALGGSGRLLVWGTLLEVGALGLVGGVLGILGGLAVAGPVSASLGDFTQKSAGIPIDIRVQAPAVIVALAVGIGVSVLAALGPARRAVRIDVAAELAGRGRREDIAKAGSVPRIAVAVGGMAGGLALCFLAQRQGGVERWQAQLAPLGFLATVIPSVYVVATLVPRLLEAYERRARFRRASTRLALANLRREPRRAGVLAIALAFAMGIGFVTASFKASVADAIEQALNGHLTGVEVSSTDPENSATNDARLSPDVLARLAAVPEVDHLERTNFSLIGSTTSRLTAIIAYTNPWLSDDVALGALSRARLDAGEVAIGPALARDEHLRPGDTLQLATASGRVSLPVMAVLYDGDTGGRNVLMSERLFNRLYGRQAPVTVLAQPRPGVDDHELVAAIERAHIDPSLQIKTSQQVLDRNVQAINSQLSSFDALQRGLLVMSFIAVLSTLLLVGVQRQREFGMLAAVGMTPPELRRMILSEAGMIAVAAVLLGALGSFCMYWALHLITPVIIGYQDPFRLALGSLVAYGAVSIAVALVAALYPGRRAGRVEVLEALRYE